jgi:LydA holin phage, holin superfamily III
MFDYKLPNDLIWIIIAVLGGVARYLNKFLAGEETVSIGRVLATVFVTGFCGYMTAQVMMLMYPPWTVIGAGIGGWAGTQIMDTMVQFLKFKINGNNEKT